MRLIPSPNSQKRHREGEEADLEHIREVEVFLPWGRFFP